MDMAGKTIDELYAIAANPGIYGHSGICAHLPRMVALVKEAIAGSGSCRVVELGIGGGDQSTVAWLYALKNLGVRGELHCYDVNSPATLPELQRLAAEQQTQFTFNQGSTLTAVARPSDILFVDTLHTKEQVDKELALFAPSAQKYIAFHDTEAFKRAGQFLNPPVDNSGVLDSVEQFVNSTDGWGLKEHYLDDNGFLVLAKGALLPARRIDASNANVAVVIGTFAAVPYVHLSLAALRKHEPGIKIAVHDDCSPKRDALLKLCAEYDATLNCLPQRKKPTVGDMSAMAYAARYAVDNDCQIGVKISRRFIINRPFVAELRNLFHNMQSPTLCGADATYGFGYRSEAAALWAPAWVESGVVHEMETFVAQDKPYHALPEAWYHDRAKFLHNAYKTKLRAKYDQLYPPAPGRAGFVDWPLLGLSRGNVALNTLWHDSNTPADYAALAAQFDLPYTVADFNDPNMGFGSRPAQ